MKKYKHNSEDYSIPAGILIGLGVGMFLGNLGAGVLTGLGVGFLLMMIIKLTKGE